MSRRKVVVIGGGGQIGEGIKAHKWSDDVTYLAKESFNIFSNNHFDKLDADTLVDLVPSPFVSTDVSNDKNNYDDLYTKPHINFIEKAISNGGVKNYIFISSGGAVYGDVPHGVIITEENKTCPVSNYGKSKVLIENALLELAERYCVRAVILRPGSAFNYNPRSSRQRGLIGALLNSFLNEKPFTLFGSMDISKDYISNRDIGHCVIKSVQSDVKGIFNIGSEKAYSIEQMIKLFEDKFKKTIPIICKEGILSDVGWYCLGSDRARNELGFTIQDELESWLGKVAGDEFEQSSI